MISMKDGNCDTINFLGFWRLEDRSTGLGSGLAHITPRNKHRTHVLREVISEPQSQDTIARLPAIQHVCYFSFRCPPVPYQKPRRATRFQANFPGKNRQCRASTMPSMSLPKQWHQRTLAIPAGTRFRLGFDYLLGCATWCVARRAQGGMDTGKYLTSYHENFALVTNKTFPCLLLQNRSVFQLVLQILDTLVLRDIPYLAPVQ